jgi:hypothetical protein
MEKHVATNLRTAPGHLLRDNQLRDTAGQSMMFSDYRGESNLVLITSRVENTVELAGLLREFASQAARLREYEAQMIVISSCAERFDFPAVRILLDSSGNALREIGAPAVYITDKFREIRLLQPCYCNVQLAAHSRSGRCNSLEDYSHVSGTL